MHRMPQRMRRDMACATSRRLRAGAAWRWRRLTAPRCALLFLVVAQLCGLHTAHGEDIYRWKDDNNITTFSQRPPATSVYVERLLHRGSSEANAFSDTAAFGSWRAVSSPAPNVERTQGIEPSGIRPAETPAEQELSERLDALAEVKSLKQAPQRALRSRWIETRTQPKRSLRH